MLQSHGAGRPRVRHVQIFALPVPLADSSAACRERKLQAAPWNQGVSQQLSKLKLYYRPM